MEIGFEVSLMALSLCVGTGSYRIGLINFLAKWRKSYLNQALVLLHLVLQAYISNSL